MGPRPTYVCPYGSIMSTHVMPITYAYLKGYNMCMHAWSLMYTHGTHTCLCTYHACLCAWSLIVDECSVLNINFF